MTRRLLVANRGEIAVRVIRTAHVEGWETIAVYSDADAGALWTRLATSSAAIGGVSVTDSYLSIDRMIDVARQNGATAVHPGYGMLSENAQFAEAVRAAGMAFVGPAPDIIALMGDKVRARAVASAVGVAVLPGSDGAVSDAEAASIAEVLGWPVMIKASHGGGGRGMRIASDAATLAAACIESRREAFAAFGRDEIFLEAYLPIARHIEVQIMGGANGELLVLGDRDCSLQRRRQKLIEEAPAPGLGNEIRCELHKAARLIAQNVGYLGAGTVEFLVDIAGGRIFFLELNTRLQVEHGVTELVTGLDLVALQLRAAEGNPLGVVQEDVAVAGHAIEARISAEIPAAGFLPDAGRLSRAVWPGGPCVRCDSGVAEGDEIPQYYDSMFAKVMAWAPDRDTARRRLLQALAEVDIIGVEHTGPFATALLAHPGFATNDFHVASVENEWSASLGMALSDLSHGAPPPVASRRIVPLPWGNRETLVAIAGNGCETANGAGRTAIGAIKHTSTSVGAPGGPRVTSPMDGIVVAVNVSQGATVVAGQVIVTLESMKMELAVRAQREGKVVTIHAEVGRAVAKGALLAVLGPN